MTMRPVGFCVRPSAACMELKQPSTGFAKGMAPSLATTARARGDLQICRHKVHEFSLWRGELPVPAGFDERGCVSGARTAATPLLSAQQVLDRLNRGVHGSAREHFGAFYSSEMGGIVTNPALMAIHMDDHMVHRGHAVMESVPLVNGKLYKLPQHMQRLQLSAHMAGIVLPLSIIAMSRIVMDTAAASRKTDGMVKIWLSPGRGGLGLSSVECVEASFYVIASSEPSPLAAYQSTGMAAHASSVPPKPAVFHSIGGTDFLQSAMAVGDGSDVGVFVDSGGYILEAPYGSVGIVTKDSVVVMPPCTASMHGIVMQQLLDLIPEVGRIKGVEERALHADEVAKAKEAFIVGGSNISPIVTWEGKAVGAGKPGPAVKSFADALANKLLESHDLAATA